MKFLFLTDTHIRNTNPQGRKDNFFETVFKKLDEIIEIAQEKNVDAVLHGGDLFDRPDTPPSLVREVVIRFKKIDVPIYMVAGNHDIYGQNPNTIKRTMIGLLDSMGIIKLINPEEKVFLKKNGVTVRLTGTHYSYNLDKEGKISGYIVKKDDCDVAIHMVHGMLLEKPLFHTAYCTTIDEILSTQADITLSGHYHSGYGIKYVNGRYFVNPGSIVRIDSSLIEISRMPKVSFIKIEKDIIIENITLKSALPGYEILDRTKLEEMEFKEKKLAEFIQSVNSASNFKSYDFTAILNEISQKNNIKKEVVEEALKKIEQAQIDFSFDGEDLEVI